MHTYIPPMSKYEYLNIVFLQGERVLECHNDDEAMAIYSSRKSVQSNSTIG